MKIIIRSGEAGRIRGKRTPKPVKDGTTLISVTNIEPGSMVAIFEGPQAGPKTLLHRERVGGNRMRARVQHKSGTDSFVLRVRQVGVKPYECLLRRQETPVIKVKAVQIPDSFYHGP